MDDDGMVVIRGRLSPEVGAVVQRALEAAAHQLFREAQGEPKATSIADEVTPGQRRADALGLLAEAALAGDFDRGSAGDRYQVMLHVEMPTGVAAGEGLCGTVEADHGAVDVSAHTSRRLSCDASVAPMHTGTDCAVLDVGRKTRTVPPSIRRALEAGSELPISRLTARRCDAHHLEHWVDGGGTSLGNLMLLCRRHHRAVHEGGFAVVRRSDGSVMFLRPGGAVLETVPALPAVSDGRDRRVDDIPVWDGARFDLGYAVDVLYREPSGDPRAAASARAC